MVSADTFGRYRISVGHYLLLDLKTALEQYFRAVGSSENRKGARNHPWSKEREGFASISDQNRGADPP